ncbi:MAG: hypothetical protein RL318_2613 [Fibrobacterota bacterium]|jgi:hypothetical protein
MRPACGKGPALPKTPAKPRLGRQPGHAARSEAGGAPELMQFMAWV